MARTEQATGWTVNLSTALNRTTSYQVEHLPMGELRRTVTAPSGGLTTSVRKTDGTTTITAPDGTITTQVEGPDPRFGMQSPILKSLTVATPLGLSSSLTTTRTVTLSNPNDPLSLATQTDTLVINGSTYTSTYTQATRLLRTTTPAGRISDVTLDAKGRVVQEQVTGLDPVAYTYDTSGRLATITQGTGVNVRTSTLTYNSKHELTTIQDPLLRDVGFAYDLAGRITTQTLPDTRTIGYAYDANGNVTGITPPGRPVHQFNYTPVDLESNYNPPDAGFSPRNTQYAYNLDRQLTTVTRPDGQAITLGYEPTGGRLSTLTLPGSQVTAYAYGATTGTLSSITAPGSTLSYTYDGSLLKSTTWAGTIAGSVSRNYDNNFRITSQSVNGGNTINFGYDNDSLLTSAGSLTIVRSAQNGLITGTTLGTVTDTRGYTTFGELSSYTANVSGSPVFSTTYTRDKLGRLTQKVETVSGTTTTFDYAYDTAGRLQEVKTNGAVTATYGYDSNGNRTSYIAPSINVTGTYDAQDRLTSYGQLNFTYTANGELLTKSNPTLGQTATFSYDVLGNLKTANFPGGVTIEYVVDGQNRRIGKKVSGTLTQGFLYQNQLNPVAELDGAGAVVSRFVYGTKANVPDYMIKGGVTYRIVSDHRNSQELAVMKKRISNVIEDLYQREQWARARALILEELKKDSTDHWYLTRLSGTYYEEHRYRKALEISDKAVKLAPRCPLALWDRAGILDMLGKYTQALAIWRQLLKRGTKSVAYGPCGEGLVWAQSLLNDCRYQIADTYRTLGKLDQSRLYVRSYLKHRSLGVKSIYDKRMVKKKFTAVL
ncbi:MAG: hypothetical protein U0223_13295 [Nitrospira sp.]|nr:hypothetical protein [Nitrospira sp.]